jgi:hypothetical protein
VALISVHSLGGIALGTIVHDLFGGPDVLWAIWAFVLLAITGDYPRLAVGTPRGSARQGNARHLGKAAGDQELFKRVGGDDQEKTHQGEERSGWDDCGELVW